jgi:hypothetical protein
MEDLGLPHRKAAPKPIPLGKVGEVDERRPTDLPERFVNLALAAYSQRLFEKSELGRFLRLSVDQVDRFLSWCPIPRAPKALLEEELAEIVGDGAEGEAEGEMEVEAGNGRASGVAEREAETGTNGRASGVADSASDGEAGDEAGERPRA